MRAEVAAAVPALRRRPPGARPGSTSAPASAPAGGGRGRGCTTRAAAPASPPTSSPTAATAPGRPAGRLVRLRARMSDGRDELAAGLGAVSRRGSPRPARTPAAPADDVRLVVVTKSFPAATSGCWPSSASPTSAENRHQEAEARRRSAPTSTLALALHRRPAEQQGGAVGGVRRGRRVRRPAQAGAAPVDRARTGAPPRRRAAPGRPRPARARRPVGRRPGRARRPGRRGARGRSMLTLRGPDGGRAAGEDPAAAFARLAEIRAGVPRAVPRRRPGSRRG